MCKNNTDRLNTKTHLNTYILCFSKLFLKINIPFIFRCSILCCMLSSYFCMVFVNDWYMSDNMTVASCNVTCRDVDSPMFWVGGTHMIIFTLVSMAITTYP